MVVVLSEGALDRCITDTDHKDFVRKEIALALAMNKTIVPVHTTNFVWPAVEVLPEDIRGLLSQNAVEWHHAYTDAAAGKMVRFLRHQ